MIDRLMSNFRVDLSFRSKVPEFFHEALKEHRGLFRFLFYCRSKAPVFPLFSLLLGVP